MLLSAYTPQDDTWAVETARANEDRRIWKVAACPLGLCISVLFCMPYHPCGDHRGVLSYDQVLIM